jgi:hypothetical protein
MSVVLCNCAFMRRSLELEYYYKCLILGSKPIQSGMVPVNWFLSSFLKLAISYKNSNLESRPIWFGIIPVRRLLSSVLILDISIQLIQVN